LFGPLALPSLFNDGLTSPRDIPKCIGQAFPNEYDTRNPNRASYKSEMNCRFLFITMKRSQRRMLMMKKKSRLMFTVTRLVMKKIMSAEASGSYGKSIFKISMIWSNTEI